MTLTDCSARQKPFRIPALQLLLPAALLLLAGSPTAASDQGGSVGGEESSAASSFGDEEIEGAHQEALEEVETIAAGIQSLKSRVIGLNKDLRLMEEKILYPSATQYAFFLSLNSGQFFQLEGVKLKIDGELVASHVYSGKQREALVRGGIHRLHVTNLSPGEHTVTVFFTGLGSNERPYKRAVSLDFDKGPGSGYLEIAVGDDTDSREPAFRLRQW